MKSGELGKTFQDGEIIIHQNDVGECMFVIQSGQVEIFQNKNKREVRLATLKSGDFFGEMAIFDHEVRSASVRALGEVRVLTVDKKNFLKRVHEDPSLAYHIVQTMSQRIRHLDAQNTRIKAADRRNWDKRPEVYNGRN